ncbi:MAG: sialate O-acetylesterase [Opitutaceae bacterium]|jgi:sialate O-acetylesterase
MRYTLFCLALLGLGASARADVIPAPLFTDNAVLQRDKPIPVWGTADAGEKVSVSFAGQAVETVADATGKWSVKLAPIPAKNDGSALVIKGNNTITLANVVVGEVWLASGQSNMEWVVKNTYDAAIDVPASANFPLIRHIQIAKKVSETPLATAKGAWQVAGPDTTGGFTAAGYYFARDLYQLLHVPVGIINSSWGGTPVESWIDPEAYKTVPTESAKVQERWTKVLADYPANKAKFDADLAAWTAEESAAKAKGEKFTKQKPRGPQGPGHPNTPSGLNNGMINPLVPYALRGAIWYQGESNAGRANEYRALFSSMITGWRTQFGQGDFPFYWVQLANYNNPDGTNWGFLREAQTQTLALPATGQAVIIDIGNRRDIHPRNKKDVGRRLARLALKNDYGIAIETSGPLMETATREGTGFKVTFTHIDGGLIAPLNELTGFELAGADKVFKPADAKIEGDTVIVTSAAVAEPVAVRYAWRDAPTAGLFNKNSGLPAAPFRSDTW